MSRTQLQNVLLFAVSLGVAITVGSREAWALGWLRYATYFTLFAVTGVWLVRWIDWARARWASPVAVLRANAPEIALAVGATALLFLTHDWQFKVLSDETNLVGVGRAFAFDWRFDFPDTGKFYYGTHHYGAWTFDKRPPLFGFVLGLVDALTGYRVRNVWLLNGAILGVTALVAAGFLRRRVGRPWNLLAVVWALANPIVMQTASAAGVEPILCLVWAIAGALMLESLEDASSPSFPLLVGTVVLLGLTRLEAGPLAALMLGAVLVASPERRKLFERLRDDWLVWATPLVAMPVVIQRTRSKDYFQGLTSKPFSFQYVVENARNWKRIFADGGKFFPYSPIVTSVEVIAIVALVALVLFRRTAMSKAERAAFLVFAALTSAFVALYSTYFWGQPTAPASARFYALPLFFAGLAVVWPLVRWRALASRPWAACVAFGLVFAHAFPSSHNRAFPDSINWRREHIIITETLLPRLATEQILLVTALPSQFIIYDMGTMSFEGFKKSRASVMNEIDRKLYTLYVAQEINYADGKPTAATTLGPGLELETVLERQFSSASFLRISRLVRAPKAPVVAPHQEPAPANPAP